MAGVRPAATIISPSEIEVHLLLKVELEKNQDNYNSVLQCMLQCMLQCSHRVLVTFKCSLSVLSANSERKKISTVTWVRFPIASSTGWDANSSQVIFHHLCQIAPTIHPLGTCMGNGGGCGGGTVRECQYPHKEPGWTSQFEVQ